MDTCGILRRDFKLPSAHKKPIVPIIFPYMMKKTERVRLHKRIANMIDPSGMDYRGIPVGSDLSNDTSAPPWPSSCAGEEEKDGLGGIELDMVGGCEESCDDDNTVSAKRNLSISLNDACIELHLSNRIRKNNGVIPTPLKALLYDYHDLDGRVDDSTKLSSSRQLWDTNQKIKDHLISTQPPKKPIPFHRKYSPLGTNVVSQGVRKVS
jgi:hypothetical protein